jgi:hypothetical protein
MELIVGPAPAEVGAAVRVVPDAKEGSEVTEAPAESGASEAGAEVAEAEAITAPGGLEVAAAPLVGAEALTAPGDMEAPEVGVDPAATAPLS